MYEVYKITCSVTSKCYVGYTKQGANTRLKEHLDNAKSKPGALARAIVKHGKTAFSVEVLWSGETHTEACAEEIRLIAELETLTPGGYNLTYGGDGVPLTREQIDAANEKRRVSRTPKQIARWEKMKGVFPEHLVDKIGHMKGLTQTPEWVEKRISTMKANGTTLKGRPWSDARRAAQCARGLV